MKKAALKKLAKIAGEICDARNYIDELRENEQDSYDAHTDAWQESEKGEDAWTTISNLETLVDLLENAENILDEMTGEDND